MTGLEVADVLARFYAESYRRNLGLRIDAATLREALKVVADAIATSRPIAYAPAAWIPSSRLTYAYRVRHAFRVRSELSMFADTARRFPDARLVDFGCGGAEFLKGAITRGYASWGLGIDTVLPKMRGTSKCAFVGDLASARAACDRVHIVTAFFVLHHLTPSQMGEYFDFVGTALVPGGAALVLEDAIDLDPQSSSSYDEDYRSLSLPERRLLMAVNDYWSNVVIYGRTPEDQNKAYRTAQQWQQLFECAGFELRHTELHGFDVGRLHGIPALSLECQKR